MTVQNLSIVWGPNLFRVENEKNSMSVVASQFDIAATDFLISHYEEICEGSFYFLVLIMAQLHEFKMEDSKILTSYFSLIINKNRVRNRVFVWLKTE